MQLNLIRMIQFNHICEIPNFARVERLSDLLTLARAVNVNELKLWLPSANRFVCSFIFYDDIKSYQSRLLQLTYLSTGSRTWAVVDTDELLWYNLIDCAG